MFLPMNTPTSTRKLPVRLTMTALLVAALTGCVTTPSLEGKPDFMLLDPIAQRAFSEVSRFTGVDLSHVKWEFRSRQAI